MEVIDLDAVARTLHERTLRREAREIARLHQVLELAAHDGCQAARLGEHFGESIGRMCGHCSWCLGGRRPALLLGRLAVTIDASIWRRAAALRAEQPSPLADPRAFARFLCGLTSPKLSRSRLGSNSLFGVFAQVPFGEVLERTQAG